MYEQGNSRFVQNSAVTAKKRLNGMKEKKDFIPTSCPPDNNKAHETKSNPLSSKG